jgi:hypothetical protein
VTWDATTDCRDYFSVHIGQYQITDEMLDQRDTGWPVDPAVPTVAWSHHLRLGTGTQTGINIHGLQIDDITGGPEVHYQARYHQDAMHSNGIIGDSQALTPTTDGTVLSLAQIYGGEIHISGFEFTAIPETEYDFDPGTGFYTHYLLGLGLDSQALPQIVVWPRASAPTSALNINGVRISWISEDTPVGSHTLVFTALGSTLSWDAGPQVPVVYTSVPTVYRIPSKSQGFIEVQIVSILPVTNKSDVLTVLRLIDPTSILPVCSLDADGAGVIRHCQDIRPFGTLSWRETATDASDFDRLAIFPTAKPPTLGFAR